MNARIIRLIVLFAFLVGALVVPASASAKDKEKTAVNIEELFASLHVAVDGTHIDIEASTNRETGGVGVSISLYRYPEFSGSCYIENPAKLKIDKHLKSASLNASCDTFNSFEYFPAVYTIEVRIEWHADGSIERNHIHDRLREDNVLTMRNIHGGSRQAAVTASATVNGEAYVQSDSLTGNLAYLRGKTKTTVFYE